MTYYVHKENVVHYANSSSVYAVYLKNTIKFEQKTATIVKIANYCSLLKEGVMFRKETFAIIVVESTARS